MAREVALQQPGRFAAALAFGDASLDVGLCRGVVLTSLQDDRVQGAVELAITAAAESVPDRLAAGGGHGRDAGEAGEGGFGADAAWVRPGNDQIGGDDRSDARFIEQPWCEHTDMAEDLTLELLPLPWSPR